jgi:Glycosyl transferase family 2
VNDAGLRIAVGVGAIEPGVLRMGRHVDDDIPFRAGDDFPFEDRAVGDIECGRFVRTLSRAEKLRFLLECRRTLQPGGLLAVAPPDNDNDLLPLARLAGLEPAPGGYTRRDRRLRGDPLVSILIPAYNARFFTASLDSALAQTYGNIEIVVCDDSPGREIEEIACGRAGSIPIRYQRNETRLGPRRNFTRCFERARGEFVKFLCDDDLLAPECVGSLLDAFRHAPDVALATSRRRRIDASGGELGDQPATVPIVSEDSLIAGRTLSNAMIVAGLNIIGEPSTALFRKSDLLDQAPEYFRFDGEPGHGIIDMVTWAALLLKGDAVYRISPLSAFRIHSGQRQHDPAKAGRNVASIRALQTAWVGLGFLERLPPEKLLVRPFPAEDGAPWRWEPMLGFAARPVGGAPARTVSLR